MADVVINNIKDEKLFQRLNKWGVPAVKIFNGMEETRRIKERFKAEAVVLVRKGDSNFITHWFYIFKGKKVFSIYAYAGFVESYSYEDLFSMMHEVHNRNKTVEKIIRSKRLKNTLTKYPKSAGYGTVYGH